jgi:WD40 repeat protein
LDNRSVFGAVIGEKAMSDKNSEELPFVPEAEWQKGDVVMDLYDIKDIHTRGGMGLVYRAYHRNWDIDLAIKSPRKDFFTTEKQKEKFTRECQTWINLGLHPHIVNCFYVRRINNIPRVFAEYVDGGTLNDWIYGWNNEPPRLYRGSQEEILERILDISIQFAMGLLYSHRKGLVHQDVKPLNVMMTPEDGIVKITDFGLSRLRVIVRGEENRLGAEHNKGVTGSAMTLQYCSPEQEEYFKVAYKKGIPHDQWPKLTLKTDIWSWAVSILEMFIGKPRREKGSAAGDSFNSYYNEKQFKIQMPGSVADLLRRCFKKVPRDRPNMTKIALVLKEIYQKINGQAYSREEPKPAELLAGSLNNRALSMLDLEKKDEAVKFWRDALRSDPQHPDSTFNYGYYQWQRGKLDDGAFCTTLSAVAAVCENNPSYHYNLANIYIDLGEPEKAKEALDTAQRLGFPDQDSVETLLKKIPGYTFQPLRALFSENKDKVGFENNEAGFVVFSPDSRYILWSRKFKKELKQTRNEYTSPSKARTDLIAGDKVTIGQLLELKDEQPLIVETFSKTRIELIDVSNDPNIQNMMESRESPLIIGALREILDTKLNRCRIFDLHTEDVVGVFLPGGQCFILGGKNGTLRLWHIAGQCIQSFTGHKDAIISCAVSSNSQYFVTGSRDKTIKLWEVTKNEAIACLAENSEAAALLFSPDGKCLLAVTSDELLIYNTKSWECIVNKTLPVEGPKNALCFSPDGKYVAFGTWDDASKQHFLHLVEVETGVCIKCFKGHLAISSLCFSHHDGRYIICANGGNIKIWDIEREICIRSFGEWTASMYGIGSAALSPDDQYLFSTQRFFISTKWTAHIYHHSPLECWKMIYKPSYTFIISRPFHALEVHEAEKAVRNNIRSSKEFIKRGNFADAYGLLQESRELQGFERHRDEILELSNDCGMQGGQLKGLSQWWEAKTLSGHSGNIRALAFSPDGKYLATGSSDKTIKIWEVKSGLCERTIDGTSERISSVVFCPDRNCVISGSIPIKLWDFQTGKCVQSFDEYKHSPGSMAISKSGKFLLSGGNTEDDFGIWLWDVYQGKRIRVFSGHKAPVLALAFSLDEKLVISGSEDGTLRIWKIDEGINIRIYKTQNEWVKQSSSYITYWPSVVFSSNAKYALCRCSDKAKLSGKNDEKNDLDKYSRGPRVKLEHWNLFEGKCIKTLNVNLGSTIEELVLSFFPNSHRFALSVISHDLALCDLYQGKSSVVKAGERVDFMTISPDCRFIAIANFGDKTSSFGRDPGSNAIKLWEIVWDWDFSKGKGEESSKSIGEEWLNAQDEEIEEDRGLADLSVKIARFLSKLWKKK